MSNVYANQPVVIDNGTGTIKAGFAGGERPDLIFSSHVGRPKHQRAMASAVEGDFFVGDKAVELRGILKLNYPMKHGVVQNWDDMQRLWNYVYEKLHCSQDEHPVLLTEAPINPRQNRAMAAEVFFERFNAPSLYIAAQAILSLYASGRTTGVVLDSGDGVSHCVPVFEGFALPHAISRMDLAGRDVTEHLQLLLQKSGHSFHTSSELETVRDIKERLCHVAFERSESALETKDKGVSYRLPDHRVINVGPERFRGPEILFTPELIGLEYGGVHQCLTRSIQKADLDLRRTLYSQIVLAGGSTMFPGYGDRLLSEVRKLAPQDTKIRIFAPSDRMLTTWMGGSILASLSTFKKMWTTKKEYEEMGDSVIFRRMF
eukprot:76081_1